MGIPINARRLTHQPFYFSRSLMLAQIRTVWFVAWLRGVWVRHVEFVNLLLRNTSLIAEVCFNEFMESDEELRIAVPHFTDHY